MAALMNLFASELLRRKQSRNRQKVSGEARRFGARAPLPIPQKNLELPCSDARTAALLSEMLRAAKLKFVTLLRSKKMQDKLNFIHEASGAPVKGLLAMGEQAASVAKTALELYKQALNMQNACQVVAETQQSMNELHHEFAQQLLMVAESQQTLPNQPNTTNQPKMTNFPMARADVSHVPLQLHPRPLSFTPGEDPLPPPYSFFNQPPP